MKSKQIFFLLLSVALVTTISTTLTFQYLQNHIASKQIIPEAQAMPVNLLTSKSPANLNLPPRLEILNGFEQTASVVTNSVVNINVFFDNGTASVGSGVIVSNDGYIITNSHVIEGKANEYRVSLANKKEYKAKLVGMDYTTDIALLKVEAYDLIPIKYGNSDAAKVGQWVLAVGNPLNLTSSVTAGIISAKGRNIDIIESNYGIESFIQTDAVVNPGNSGGALVNTAGQLIGINTAILSETGTYSGYSFAIPSNLVQKVINDLKKYGEVNRALLGVNIADINNETAKILGLRDLNGVYINSVAPQSSASIAGLAEGDVIVGINKIPTNSVPDLQEQIGRLSPGDIVEVEFIRGRQLYKSPEVALQGF